MFFWVALFLLTLRMKPVLKSLSNKTLQLCFKVARPKILFFFSLKTLAQEELPKRSGGLVRLIEVTAQSCDWVPSLLILLNMLYVSAGVGLGEEPGVMCQGFVRGLRTTEWTVCRMDSIWICFLFYICA